MTTSNADIIAQLHRDILSLQGFKQMKNDIPVNFGLGPIKYAFPGSVFPRAAIHEFMCTNPEDESATAGFVAGILSALMQNKGVTLWINSSPTIFAPAFKTFGIEPDKIIFINLKKEKEILWVIEEALKCDGLATVVGKLQHFDFTASRRFQLAVEQSGVTGFIFCPYQKTHRTTASTTRWKITSLPGEWINDMPGVGFPKWNVELLKVRNGKPGTWQVGWMDGKFHHERKLIPMTGKLQKKTG